MLPEPKNTQTKYSETEIASGSEVSYNNNNLVSPSTLDSQPLNYDDYFLENEDLLQEKEINETCFRQSDIKPKKLVSTVKDVEYNSGYNVKIVKGDKTEDSIAVRTHTDLQMQNETKKDKKTEYKKMTKDKETTSKVAGEIFTVERYLINKSKIGHNLNSVHIAHRNTLRVITAEL
ncbi:PREDICTED: uncharacterized protein LOC105557352 [Vollenhovia emeryi]|uniref:uncharacterized protein LOC105557352 n=1 Tax=Vollenhovia emeryi TaxID=411798 RepID=UPI0005F3E810|nr:PREDICTED: uncharacterized protein LOC105557352 [Vollenhovia emeryi]